MAERPRKEFYPGLFRPGFFEIAFENIDQIFANEQSTPRRKMLAAQLRMFIKHLQAMGVHGDLWINGSFSTHNPNPMDYDVLLVISRVILRAMTEEQRAIFAELSSEENHDYVRSKWGCDFYVAESNDAAKQRRFEAAYSSNPDSENKKGIAVIKI